MGANPVMPVYGSIGTIDSEAPHWSGDIFNADSPTPLEPFEAFTVDETDFGDIDKPSADVGSVISFPLPPAIESPSWRFFEDVGNLIPEFDTDWIFEDLKGKISDKIPLDWIDKIKDKSGTMEPLSWTISPGMFGVDMGTYTFAVDFNVWTQYAPASTIRLILLFVLCLYFLFRVFGLFFAL